MQVHETKVRLPKPAPTHEYTFGKTFTDHMLTIDWDAKNGWGKPVI